MAVTTQESNQFEDAYTDTPATMLSTNVMTGKMRVARVIHDQSGAGDATSSVALFKLPPGRCTLLLQQSYAYVNWTTASATLDLGWDAYHDRNGTAVAADPDGLLDGLNVDTAGVFNFDDDNTTSAGAVDFDSLEGVTIRATSQDVAIADGDDFNGYFFYIVD